MRQQFASNNASLVRGFAWHVYPDPAAEGVMAGETPFGPPEPPGPDRSPARAPGDVLDFWLIGRNTPGIHNHHEGHSYLVLTDHREPPEVTAGWFVEPARLDDSFQLDQRDDRWVRLVRVVETFQAPGGALADCEFQIDRT